MASVTVRLDGLDDVLKKLDSERMRAAAERGMRKGVTHVHQTVPPYPAPPPNSSYRRTGLLGRSITTKTERSAGNILGIIGSNVDYAPVVIGEGTQAPVHQGRWWTLWQVVNKAKGAVVDFIRDEVDAAWKG
jgi:hypothetical protein